MEFLSRLFGNNDSSKNMAKERLRLVLVQDRAMLSPGLLDSLQEDLIEVISKYMELDVTGLEVNLESQDQSVALVASIPVKNVKR